MYDIGIVYWDNEENDYIGAYGGGETREAAFAWAKQWATKYGDGSYAVSLFREAKDANHSATS